MEHSQAIMEDAGKAIDAAAAQQNGQRSKREHGEERSQDNDHKRRKRDGFGDSRGGRGGRRGGRNDGKRHPKSDMGRGEYFRDQPDKRQKMNDSRDRRQKEGVTYGKEFSKEEIDAEGRRPKRKVAVMIGYSGTGYKGMQITPYEKTIEGDLFKAFIDAGAISKANAEDPKKSGLVRCARTDKGVHAAGNVISLKLIVEDDDIVEKINSHLSPQIRVWGIERTIGSFSSYKQCDSRWYEYLIPAYAFLPPHPSSWLAKKLEEIAKECDDVEQYQARQADVRGYWENVDETIIKPVLADLDDDIRGEVIRAIQGEDENGDEAVKENADVEQIVKKGKPVDSEKIGSDDPEQKTEGAAIIIQSDDTAVTNDPRPPPPQMTPEELDRQQRLKAATRRLRAAYMSAKRRYRIPQTRVERIQKALSKFVGTINFHNYTIQKTFKDPSAKRHIKSFVVNPEPVLIGDGPDDEKHQWLSMKVHGQSFMMHQIRKMVGMATLLVRCGSNLGTMDDSFKEERFSIPKVPGLGLLLERPVFDSYNSLQAPKHDRKPLVFSNYETELEEFKQREIYERIFREEEEKNEFTRFFNHVDSFKESHFLFVTSKGVEATRGKKNAPLNDLGDSDDEKHLEDN